MDFTVLAKERFSVRKFSGKKVEKEKVGLILEAGRLSPTAVNYQPQRILVAESEEALKKLTLCTPYHFNAPLAFLVCYDKTVSWKNRQEKDIGPIDAGIVTTSMMFQAAELGLGTTWVGVFSTEMLREQFHIPLFLEPVALLPTGYPAGDCRPSPMHFKRFPPEQTIFYNSFEGITEGGENGPA